jgi:AcrR family transcriptional regulator
LGAKPRTKYHHGDLRNALIEAALAIIAEDGPEGFTIRDAARRAGVSSAAPYRHFTDREDLLAAVAADCMQRLGDAMDRAIEAAGTGDPLAVYRATGIAYVRFAAEHPAHFRVMSMPQMAARTPPEVGAGFDDWVAGMTARLAAAQAAGTIAPMPLEHVLLAANCLTYGLARMVVDGHPMLAILGDAASSPGAAAALAEMVTGVLGIGLLPRDVAPVAPPTDPRPRRRR